MSKPNEDTTAHRPHYSWVRIYFRTILYEAVVEHAKRMTLLASLPLHTLDKIALVVVSVATAWS